MDEHEKRNKEERRKKRKEYVDKVKKIYDETQEITVLSRWREVQDNLRDNSVFTWLSKLEALTSWEEWTVETEKKELELKSKDKYRHDRKLRDAVRDLYNERYKAGKIQAATPWSSVAEAISSDPSYLAMVGVSGSSPHDVYDDFIEGLHERYKEDRNKMKKLMKAKGLVVTSTSTKEWFYEALKDDEGFLEIPEESRGNFFDSLTAKAKEQDEDAEKNAKKNRKKFVELLQKTREVTANTTYEVATKLLGSSVAWEAVDEQTRKQCFDIFVDQLKIQSESRKAEAGCDALSGAESDEIDARQKRGKKDKDKCTKKKPLEEESLRKPLKKQKRDHDEDDDEVDKRKSKKSKK